ncbi:SLBB domain-containing protein, partial [Methyloparacoccus murrellii]
LLIMAGGLQEGAEMTQAVIARADVGGNSRSMVVPIAQDYSKLTQDNKTRLEARDKISIVGFVAKDRYVTLAGHIKEPGRFILTKDMTLVDLIATRGGFQDPGFRRSVFPDMA